ncbi:MAG: HIT family protein [Actinobacteria bacterium]|nr:HIT family protein [Actinomycetota bacterium]
MTCVLCEIAAGTSPASIVYRDDTILAVMDIQPVNPGHVLVLPLRHVESIVDLDRETARRAWETALKAQRALKASALRTDGVNLLVADGEAAGQEVLHAHLHVFPRNSGDSFRLEYDWSTQPPRAELDAAAEQIRSVWA